ncbi:hypothetical protein EMCRGX_G002418 [Ephydatia muelleri]
MPIAPQVILLLAILVGAQCKILVNAHIEKVSEQALLEQQAVSETREEGTDYMQGGPTEAPGDVVPEYQSNEDLLEQQAVSETREDDTDYMQGGPTEAPGDVVPEYRSKQTRYGITSTYAIGKSKAYSARLSDRTTIRHRSNYVRNYVYGNSGAGVAIYIIDSGIDIANVEFEKRASWGIDFVEPNNSSKSDPNGHGTRVAGFAMSKTFGIAKKATAIAVRVLGADGKGNTASVIRAIQWVTLRHSTGKKSIINLSLSGPKSQATNDAVKAATNKGVHVVAAAGNEGTDACTRSPASAPSSITVMASGSDDTFASFSNYGSCAHIIAPGVNVKSVGNAVGSGTSYSSPMVAGVIAKKLSATSRRITPAEMKKFLISSSSSLKIKKVPSNTPNKLVYYPCP